MGPMTNRVRKCQQSEKRGGKSYYYQQIPSHSDKLGKTSSLLNHNRHVMRLSQGGSCAVPVAVIPKEFCS